MENGAAEKLFEEDYVDKMLDDKINKINYRRNIYDVGKVIQVKDFIIYANGLENVSFYEKVNIDNKAIGYVMKMETNCVVIAVLKQTDKISIGDSVYQSNEEFMGEFSKDAMGRMIDIFGEDKLTNKKYQDIIKLKIEEDNIPIMERTPVKRPLYTGIAGIDLIYPIGRGQRQL